MRVSRGARVLLGAAAALSAVVPVVLAASPASAAGCTASVSDATPAHNETVTVSFVGPASTSATVVAHYHGLDNSSTVTTDTNGHGSAGFAIASAAYGETVVVGVTFSATASCSTTFTPTAPASSSTTSSSTTAVLTGINGATTTTAAPTTTTAVHTGVVTAGATGPASLPFTGSATRIEALAGTALVLAGGVFLSSARRREELKRLLWPDER